MIQALLFYATYPFLYLIAMLSFRVLYKVSDGLYYLLRLSGYRQGVVITNLTNSFPEKTEAEIKRIAEDYFRYLCDLIVETLKTMRMTEKEARQRCAFQMPGWLEEMYRDKKSFIIVMGHYGNWEWAGPSFTLNTKFQLVVIYRPLSNIHFEKMMAGMRTRFGTRITPVQNTLRDMVANRSQHLITATAFIADQTASRDNAYWTTFLNQDTAVFMGTEKLAVKFNYPVVFMNMKRPRRGYYEVIPELLFDEPKNTLAGEISEAFTKRLEQEIIANPTIWLWSHRRWKHQRIVQGPVAQ